MPQPPESCPPRPPATPTISDKPTHHPHCCLALSITLITHLRNKTLTQQASLGKTASNNGCDGKYRMVVLSVGSGQGLLERLLDDELSGGGDVGVFGVEVPEAMDSEAGGGEGDGVVGLNGYLDERQRVSVAGSWDVYRPRELRERIEAAKGEIGLDLDADPATTAAAVAEDSVTHTELTKGVDKVHVNVILVFIYPRQPGLLRRYIGAYEASLASASRVSLQGIVWAGPRADWEEGYDSVFASLKKASGGMEDRERHGFHADDGETRSGGDHEGGWVVDVSWGLHAGVADGEGVAVAMRRPA